MSTFNLNGGLNATNSNLELNLLEQQQAQLQQLRTSSQPSMFRRVLGGVAGVAGNAFAPGLGGALGNMISGGAGSSAFNNSLAASGFAQNAQNAASEAAMNAVVTQADEIEEAAELQANLQKSKHETIMAVIQAIT
jgi:hypothetical protein